MVTGARGEGVKFGFAIKIIVESSIFGRELDLLFFSEELKTSPCKTKLENTLTCTSQGEFHQLLA